VEGRGKEGRKGKGRRKREENGKGEKEGTAPLSQIPASAPAHRSYMATAGNC